MKEHIPFPSIEQFRNVIRNVTHKAGLEKPILDFMGTVKLHGTNAAIVIDSACNIQFQSRNNIITEQNDNAGMAAFFTPLKNAILESLPRPSSPNTTLVIYGEWCGKGIQKGVAISSLDKMFVVFAARIVDSDGSMRWLQEDVQRIVNHDLKIYNIYEYPAWIVSIDFNNPQLSQNQLANITSQIEAECPVAKAFGVQGIGEGVVWHCITPGWESSDYWFKVKGEKHSVTKVKTLAQVDTSKLESLAEFVESVVTEERCLQGIDSFRKQLLPIDRTILGKFLSWVVADVLKEELDTIVKSGLADTSGLASKATTSAIALAAKKWFFLNEDKL
jgi:hypothetical protein